MDLAWAVNESIETLQYQLDRKNIRVVVSLEEKTYVLAEKVSLVNSVLNNLLTNAIKFSYPASIINLNTEKKDGKVLLSVTDQGIGIPDDLMKRIYSIDRRSTRFGTMGEKGTGFGIPLVKKFVSEYSGTMEIRSKDENDFPKDHGTCITIILNEALSP